MLFESQSFGEVEKNSFNCLPSKGGHIRLMPWGSSDGKESTCTAGDMGSIPGLGRCPGGGHSSPLQYFYLENPHGQRSLEGYSPWDCKESDVTEQQSTQHNWWGGPGQFSSVAQSYPTLQPHGLQHTRPPCLSPTLGVYSNSRPAGWWCHPTTISSSVVSYSSCLQSFPASGSFQIRQFFSSGDQIIGASASASVLLMNIQDWFPLGLTGLISLQSKVLSKAVSNTTVQIHQFFGAQLCL